MRAKGKTNAILAGCIIFGIFAKYSLIEYTSEVKSMEMAAKLMQRIRPKAQNPQKEINEEILQQVQQVREQMDCLETRFNLASDDALIESAIYEMNALHVKYDYLLKRAKAMKVKVGA